jgi:two-component system, chemotaxis family, chemotaxis protein CheY
MYGAHRTRLLGGPMAKILVIDDEQGIRHLLDTLLSRKGYDVVLADGGAKGLEIFRRERPDVVVLDLKMPEMDGITVLQQIRSLNSDQPVIILTGAGTPEREQQVRALGVTEFVEKEFSLHRLGDALKRLLKTSS